VSARKSLVAVWRDALRDSVLDATAKLVGFVLSTYMDARGFAFPSKATLARGSSLGEGRRAVDQAVDRLEADGFLEIERSVGRHAFRYQATLPPTAHEVRRSEWATSQKEASNVARGAPSTSHQVRPKAVKALKAGNDAAASDGASSLPEDDCLGCGRRRELVGPDFIYCRGCAVERVRSGEA
jgi:hypothetical protein